MAQFYGTMGGGRGVVSRTGSRNSGLEAHVRGWDVGVLVSARVSNDDEPRDEIAIYSTGGSNGGAPTTHLGTVRRDPETGAPVFIVSDTATWETVR